MAHRVTSSRGTYVFQPMTRLKASYHSQMTEVPIGLCVVAAREESLAHINALIARSKSYWDWSAEYLENGE
jgi:hypothetical protein